MLNNLKIRDLILMIKIMIGTLAILEMMTIIQHHSILIILEVLPEDAWIQLVTTIMTILNFLNIMTTYP